MSGQAGASRVAGARSQARYRPAGVAGLAAIVIVVSLIPYLCGYVLAPPGQDFLGALNNVGDLTQYLAAIRQGAAGAWLYTNQFTPDPATRLLMYLPYLLAGHFSLGLSPAAVFQLLRLACAAVCLFAMARFCALFVGTIALRAAWLLVVLAGGLYWLALPLSGLGLHVVEPAQLTAPEFSPLLTILISPHESLGLAAELLGFTWFLGAAAAARPLWSDDRPVLAAIPQRNRRMVLASSAAFLVLALSYPFLLPTVGLTLLVQAGVAARGAWHARLVAATPKRRLRAGDVLAGELRDLAIAFGPAALIGLYYWWVFRHDPLWSHSGLTQTGGPDLPVLAFTFGPLALGAYAGVRVLHRQRRAGRNAVPAAWAWFPAIWAVVDGLLLLVPIWQQGRQALGLSVPLALLSFYALAGPRAIRASGKVALPPLPASVLAFSSPLLVALYTAITVEGLNRSYYAPQAVIQAVHWIGDHAGTRDVVLASAGFSNLVPVDCTCRVVVGQNFQSFDWERRQREVHAFFGAATPAGARSALATLVRREHITLLVYGPFERTLGHVDLQPPPGFRLSRSEDGLSIYSRAATTH